MPKHITITFDVDGAAFEETTDGEYRRIFKRIANQIADGEVGWSIRDLNGNIVGEWQIGESPE